MAYSQQVDLSNANGDIVNTLGHANGGTDVASPGAAGNFLVSNGTSWTSAAASTSGLNVASTTLTSAQIKTLHGTPVQLVAAPGSGKVIVPMWINSTYDYGGTNAFTAGNSQTIQLYYSTTSSISTLVSNIQLTGTTTVLTNSGAVSLSVQLTSENLPINLYQPNSATEISGNAAGNNTVTIQLMYLIYTP